MAATLEPTVTRCQALKVPRRFAAKLEPMVTNGSEAARPAFAARLNEMLDDVGFARHGEGRQVELARLSPALAPRLAALHKLLCPPP